MLTDFSNEKVTIDEVKKVVNSLPNKNSCGYDELNTKIIKESINLIAPVLVYLFNMVLIQGIYPNALKLAKVIPLYKRDGRTSVENYRPISLLPIISKILEKIIHARLTEFLNGSSKLSATQHGFVKGKSTRTAVNELIGSVKKTQKRINGPYAYF